MQDWKAQYESGKAGGRYSQEVLDHFQNPRNVGRIEDPDGVGVYGDPSCGDYLEVTLKLEGDVVSDVRFLVHGCPGAISTSSAMTCLVKGKSLLNALELTDDDVVSCLGGIPANKRHCSLLGVSALRLALADAILMQSCIEQGLVKDKEAYRKLKAEQGFLPELGQPGHACDGSCEKGENGIQ